MQSRLQEAYKVTAIALAVGATLVVVASLANRYEPVRAFRANVTQAEITSSRILYSWSGIAGVGDTDQTVIAQASSCRGSFCPTSGAISGCAERTAECVPPVTVKALPLGLLSPPVNNYPLKYRQAIKNLLEDSGTRCTATALPAASDPEFYSEWTTLCVGQDGLVLYRVGKL